MPGSHFIPREESREQTEQHLRTRSHDKVLEQIRIGTIAQTLTEAVTLSGLLGVLNSNNKVQSESTSR